MKVLDLTVHVRCVPCRNKYVEAASILIYNEALTEYISLFIAIKLFVRIKKVNVYT